MTKSVQQAFQNIESIILYNMSPYSDWVRGVRNRNFFIVREFARAYPHTKLYLIDFTPQSIRRSARAALDSIASHRSFSQYERHIGGHTYLFKETYHLFGKRSAPIYVVSSIAPYFSLSAFANACKKLVFSTGYIPGLVWSYNPLLEEIFHTFPAKIRIFDAVDDWTAHPSLYKQKKRL